MSAAGLTDRRPWSREYVWTSVGMSGERGSFGLARIRSNPMLQAKGVRVEMINISRIFDDGWPGAESKAGLHGGDGLGVLPRPPDEDVCSCYAI